MSRWDAHAFEPSEDAPERCAVCGEPKGQIRHHPTRVRAARMLRRRGSDGESSPGRRFLALVVGGVLVVLLSVYRACS
ncbi:MAG: hypothetical protein ACQGVC_26595 [Myxococcota bacterium]